MKSGFHLGVALLGIALGGCALTPEKIDIAYTPTVGAQAIPGAGNVRIDVIVNDVRKDKERVASKSNGYGMEMAAISSNQDIVVLVRDALKNELSMRGYKTTGGNVRVVCDIFDFENKFRAGFWSGTAEASVRLVIKVRDESGRTLYDETVTGQGEQEKIQLASGKNAKPALEKALQAAIASLMARQDFHEALLRAGAAESTAQ